MIDNFLRNLRYAIRTLARTPGFTLTVVLTLALGIGANGAVFSMLDAVLLRPLPFPNADRLVTLDEAREGAPFSNIAPLRLEDWNRLNSTFEAMNGYLTQDVAETSGDLPERARLADVGPRFLDAWGITPALGRGFTAAEHQEGAPPLVMISHRFWQRRLAGDPNVLQRQIRIGDQSYPIIGVLPASFRFPDRDVDLWRATIFMPWFSRGHLWLQGIGWLKPGVTLEQARADLALVQARLAEQYPDSDRDIGVTIVPFKDATVGHVRGSLWLLFGAVSVLLLIACTNIAALLLSRAADRQREIAVRLALGAPRSSITAQALTETAVLASVGALLGLAVAAGISLAFQALVPEFPRVDEIALDGRILLYTLLSVVVVTVACGLLPAVHSTRDASRGNLAEARRTQVSARHSLHWSFVGAQVALSIMLLAGAGLLIRSMQELWRVDPGFEPNRVLSFRVSGSYAEPYQEMIRRIERMLDELGALPGVVATATSSPVPGVLSDGSGFQFFANEYEVEGRADTNVRAIGEIRIVSPSYFNAMQIPLLAGEQCRRQPPDQVAQTTQTQGVNRDVVVNEAFASRYLSGLSSVGRRLKAGDNVLTVASIVGDAREYGLEREPVPTVYQCTTAVAYPPLSFLVRTRGEPAAIAETVRAKLKEIEPTKAMYDIAPLAERIDDQYAQNRLRTILLVLFAGTALSLTCVGLYGTLSYIISLRRREVGLRVALGALRSRIVAQFLGKTLRVVGMACIAGLALSLAFTRALSGMLFGVSPSDPITLSSVIAIVMVVASLAALFPALRAARIDPMQALREE
jgi:putative ABC transport system permease protein